MMTATATMTANVQGEKSGWMRAVGSVLLLGLIAGSVGGFFSWLTNPLRSPIQRVEIKGEFRYLDRGQLQQDLVPLLGDGFFGLDVASVRSRVEAAPWVDQASVRRLWPGRLQIQIVEQQPVAHWGEKSLLNARGTPFTPASVFTQVRLPHLSGPEGHAGNVLLRYRNMSALLKDLGLAIEVLRQDARRSWHLKLSNGMTVELGRVDPEQRLARFIRVYPAILATAATGISQVDLRYSNGFSVRWAKQTDEQKTG